MRVRGDLDRSALRQSGTASWVRHESCVRRYPSFLWEVIQRITPEQGSRFHLLEHISGRGHGDIPPPSLFIV